MQNLSTFSNQFFESTSVSPISGYPTFSATTPAKFHNFMTELGKDVSFPRSYPKSENVSIIIRSTLCNISTADKNWSNMMIQLSIQARHIGKIWSFTVRSPNSSSSMRWRIGESGLVEKIISEASRICVSHANVSLIHGTGPWTNSKDLEVFKPKIVKLLGVPKLFLHSVTLVI